MMGEGMNFMAGLGGKYAQFFRSWMISALNWSSCFAIASASVAYSLFVLRSFYFFFASIGVLVFEF